MSDKVILTVEHVSKVFGVTTALKDINFEVKEGHIHSLVGRNGAGKSTIINIIAGVHKATTGKVTFFGEDITAKSFKEKQAAGIALVPQHAAVVPDMDVAENVFMGMWPKKSGGLVAMKELHEQATEKLKEYGLNVDPYTLVRYLTPVEQRKLNIIRALFSGCRFLILDEPTTSLSVEDRDNLFAFVKEYANKGLSVILISHYLEEIINVSDEITVLRDGYAYVGDTEGDDITTRQMKLAALIAGEDVELTYRDENKIVSDEVAVAVKNYSTQYLDPIDIEVYKGEILGFAGFPGSGAREFCNSIYGLMKKNPGSQVFVNGKECRTDSPERALAAGICLVPNDRHAMGIVQSMTVKENIGMSVMKKKLKSGLLLDMSKADGLAQKYVDELAIKTESIQSLLSSLSGGNQQKVVLGKAFATDPTLLILDEPTIGIDIKSREEIMLQVKNLTAEVGMSVIYLTNDFDELLRIVDRVIVFNGGKIQGIVKNENLTPDDIILLRDEGVMPDEK